MIALFLSVCWPSLLLVFVLHYHYYDFQHYYDIFGKNYFHAPVFHTNYFAIVPLYVLKTEQQNPRKLMFLTPRTEHLSMPEIFLKRRNLQASLYHHQTKICIKEPIKHQWIHFMICISWYIGYISWYSYTNIVELYRYLFMIQYYQNDLLELFLKSNQVLSILIVCEEKERALVLVLYKYA